MIENDKKMGVLFSAVSVVDGSLIDGVGSLMAGGCILGVKQSAAKSVIRAFTIEHLFCDIKNIKDIKNITETDSS